MIDEQPPLPSAISVVRLPPPEGSREECTSWNAAVQQLNGSWLQSWEWGELNRRHGFRVERIRVDTPHGFGVAQVLVKRHGPVAMAYLPRGPILSGRPDLVAGELFEAVDRAVGRHRTLVMTVEPPAPLPIVWDNATPGARRWHHQRTVQVDLGPDDVLLAGMGASTRRNISLARRRGVSVRDAGHEPAAVEVFYQLLTETAERGGFEIHSPAYYRDFLDVFGDAATLLVASVEGDIAAGVIALRFGTQAVYVFGASSSTRRGKGATALLQWETMGWARAHGCSRYDLWGISADDPSPEQRPSQGSDWGGLYHFKTGFGGTIVSYPPTIERQYYPRLARLARRFSRL